jgi:pSer/pThr/pTyr-binding forkhead associated (FHA) protein
MLELLVPGVGPVPLDRPFTIGSRSGGKADVQLDDAYVSVVHAGIDLDAHGTARLGDLGSTNGTFTGHPYGARVYVPVPLRAGMRVYVGRTELLVREQPPIQVEITRTSS